MNIFSNYKDFQSARKTAISIGMFDGVHLGHRTIIDQLKNIAEKKNLAPTLFTFHPHPRLFFNPADSLKYLTLQDEKIKILRNLGIENIIFQPFDAEFSAISGEEFITKILLKFLHVEHIIIGHDHVFGKNKSGNFDLLTALSKKYPYSVEEAQAVSINENVVSSTQIRNALLSGDISKANMMIGSPYEICGEVVHGKKIGRTLGFPTANLAVDKDKLLPMAGAYIVKVQIDSTFLPGMLSIGDNPTFGGKTNTIEVNILNFDEDIYGKTIRVFFLDFLHEQIKFSTIENLIAKLEEDRMCTLEYFNRG